MKRTAKTIALLAVAALSVTALVGCSNSSTSSETAAIVASNNPAQQKADASSLSNACKEMYAEVVAGVLNSQSTKQPAGAALPDPSASTSQKRAAAKALTVANAIDYAGLGDLTNKVGDFVYDSNGGTIYGKDDDAVKGKGLPTVTLSTTMAELFAK